MSNYELGYKAAAETITTGGSIHALLTDLSDFTEGTAEFFAGATSCALQSFVKLREAGLIAHHKDAELDAFIHAPGSVMALTLQRNLIKHTKGGETRMVDQLWILCDSIKQHQSKISFPAAQLSTPSMDVRIVSLPDRMTSSMVERNDRGEIVQTRQLEQDA